MTTSAASGESGSAPSRPMTAEHARLAEATGPCRDRPVLRQPLVRVGSLPQRARLGHRARGLLRGRRRLALVPPRPRPFPRLPVERGRDGRHQRHPPRAVPRAGPVERQGPDPQGADVRPVRARGQPRRGRQGVLVVPRGPAEPCPAQAGATTTRRTSSRTTPCPPRPRAARPRARAARHRRVRRRPVLVGRRDVRQGDPDRGADARRRREPRAGRGDPRGAAHPLVQEHLVVGARVRRGRGSRATAPGCGSPTTPWPATGWMPRPAPTAALPRRCSARTRPTSPASSVGRRARRTRRTASTTTSSPARRRSTPTASAPRPRCATG